MRILRETLLAEDELMNDGIDENDVDEIKSDDEEDVSGESEVEEHQEITKSKKKKKSKANPTFDQEDEEHEITEIGKSFLTKIYTSFVVWLNACIANICIFHLILGDSAEEDLEDVPANLPKSKKKKKKKNVNPTFEELEQDDIRPDLSEK